MVFFCAVVAMLVATTDFVLASAVAHAEVVVALAVVVVSVWAVASVVLSARAKRGRSK